MATVNVEYGEKDIVVPERGRYTLKIVWVLDSKTLKPVRIAPAQITLGS